MNEEERNRYIHMGDYDVCVIGAGHAGCEAALACARMGVKTLMFSINLEAVAMMPCNPAIGTQYRQDIPPKQDAEHVKRPCRAFSQSTGR